MFWLFWWTIGLAWTLVSAVVWAVMRIVEWGLGLLEWTAAEEEMTPRHYFLIVTTVTALVVPPVIVLRWLWSGMAPVYKEALTEIGKLALAVPRSMCGKSGSSSELDSPQAGCKGERFKIKNRAGNDDNSISLVVKMRRLRLPRTLARGSPAFQLDEHSLKWRFSKKRLEGHRPNDEIWSIEQEHDLTKPLREKLLSDHKLNARLVSSSRDEDNGAGDEMPVIDGEELDEDDGFEDIGHVSARRELTRNLVSETPNVRYSPKPMRQEFHQAFVRKQTS
jgi:hypothetical protein